MGMLYLGTSGWSYHDWQGTFYPPDLQPRERLSYMATQFSSIEINATFYRLPLAATVSTWYHDTPPNFRFAVKVSRLITHTSQLVDVQAPWELFVERMRGLREKLGPLLLQFPPTFRATPDSLRHFETFLSYASANGTRLAFELRHPTWFSPAILRFFAEQHACLVQADSGRFPRTPPGFTPAQYSYYRLHGPDTLYDSRYSDAHLAYLANHIARDLQAGDDAYIYFDNDMHGYAPADARRLSDLLTKSISYS
jgi:uncharacterized protein YecE (DUF72 family)